FRGKPHGVYLNLSEPVFGYGRIGKFSRSWSKPVASRSWEPYLSGFGVWPQTSSGANLTLAEHACCRAEGHRAIMMSDQTTCQLFWRPTWGLFSIFEPDLTSKRRPMPRLRGYRTGARGAPSDVPQPSKCRP